MYPVCSKRVIGLSSCHKLGWFLIGAMILYKANVEPAILYRHSRPVSLLPLTSPLQPRSSSSSFYLDRSKVLGVSICKSHKLAINLKRFSTMTNAEKTPNGFPNGIKLIASKLEQPDLDNRSYKVIQLPNKLEVFLVHDPDTDKASAALDVHVGNFSDKDNLQVSLVRDFRPAFLQSW